MTRFYLEITIRVSGLPADDVERLFDPLAEAVYDLTGVIDADLGARIGDSEFDFTMAVDADDEPSALTAGLSAVRCALHAAGGATPGWEDHFAAIQSLVRKQEPVAA
jgi:hypothetical protein